MKKCEEEEDDDDDDFWPLYILYFTVKKR